MVCSGCSQDLGLKFWAPNAIGVCLLPDHHYLSALNDSMIAKSHEAATLVP